MRNAPVYVAFDQGIPAAASVWAMLHVDDGTVGSYEFDGQSGLDAPIAIEGVIAMKQINLTDAATLLLADGTPVASEVTPAVLAQQQSLASDVAMMTNFLVALTVSPAPGFLDVHGDMGHPAVSLGHAPVEQGENPDVSVTLMPPPEGSMMTAITPVVWPMLHLDTDMDGQYRYLQIPGVDLPVIYNGAVVTLPVIVEGDMVQAMTMSEATAEPTPAG